MIWGHIYFIYLGKNSYSYKLSENNKLTAYGIKMSTFGEISTLDHEILHNSVKGGIFVMEGLSRLFSDSFLSYNQDFNYYSPNAEVLNTNFTTEDSKLKSEMMFIFKSITVFSFEVIKILDLSTSLDLNSYDYFIKISGLKVLMSFIHEDFFSAG